MSIPVKIIPNELNITIKTNVPGFQTIDYNPTMTIPNLDKEKYNKVIFDPLIKLNPNLIAKVSEDVKKKEFFDKGLFESLINFHRKHNIALDEATFKGYIDNNIDITLKTIFPIGSIFYINKQPYVIANLQWDKGDWKMDKKVQPMSVSGNRDYRYSFSSPTIQSQIISGENQLNVLPDNVVYGNNYTGTRRNASVSPVAKPNNNVNPVANGIISSPSLPSPSLTPLPSPLLTPLPSSSSDTDTQDIYDKSISSSRPIYNINPFESDDISDTNTLSENTPPKPKQTQNVSSANEGQMGFQVPSTPSSSPSSPTPSTPSSSPNPLKPVTNVYVNQKYNFETPHLNAVSTYSPELNKSDSSTNFLQRYFGNKNYEYMINNINSNMSIEDKNTVDNLYVSRSVRTANVQASKKEAIEEATEEAIEEASTGGMSGFDINNLTVVKNSGDGDCFFIAVADGINHYNHVNIDKITSGIYGIGDKIFTQSYLRSVVSNYIANSSDLDNYLLTGQVNVDTLNELFDNRVKTMENKSELSDEEYMDLMNNVYISNDNFLVKKPRRFPIQINDYYKPFSLFEKAEIKGYIESNSYWANVISIHAICYELKLNIITIEKTRENKLTIPYGNFLKSENNNDWNKFLYLFYSNNHYELISFSFIENKIHKRVCIFKRDDQFIVPSYYILFFIFSTYYITIDDDSKKEFTFLPNIFEITNKSFNTIYQNIELPVNNTFIKYFIFFFPVSLNKIYRFYPKIRPLKGGQTTNYINNYYNTPYNTPYRSYTNPYKLQNIQNMQNIQNKIELSYFITVYMELEKGTSLTPQQMRKASCRGKWNAVSKSYSQLTERPYIMKPDYSQTPNSIGKIDKSQNLNQMKSGKKTRNYKYSKNRTRKHNI